MGPRSRRTSFGDRTRTWGQVTGMVGNQYCLISTPSELHATPEMVGMNRGISSDVAPHATMTATVPRMGSLNGLGATEAARETASTKTRTGGIRESQGSPGTQSD